MVSRIETKYPCDNYPSFYEYLAEVRGLFTQNYRRLYSFILSPEQQDRKYYVERGLSLAKEAVAMDVKDGMSWCESKISNNALIIMLISASVT